MTELTQTDFTRRTGLTSNPVPLASLMVPAPAEMALPAMTVVATGTF